ncbi:MAG: hypothetical protein RL367_2070, partial [Pseudomonadota bacterium]
MALVNPISHSVEPPGANALPTEYRDVRPGYYVIGVLLLINIFNYMDRVLPHVMAESF